MPTCDKCRKPLEAMDLGAGARMMTGNAPVLYMGVVCRACGRLECRSCKLSGGGPLDAPCSWCGGQVSPAYDRQIAALAKLRRRSTGRGVRGALAKLWRRK